MRRKSIFILSSARWLRQGTSKSTCSTSTYSTTVHVQVPQLYCIFDCLFLTLYFWLFYFWLFIFDRDSTLKSPSPCLKIWVWRAVFGCWRPRWIAVWHRARRAQLHENKFSYDCTYVPCLSHLASYNKNSYFPEIGCQLFLFSSEAPFFGVFSLLTRINKG